MKNMRRGVLVVFVCVSAPLVVQAQNASGPLDTSVRVADTLVVSDPSAVAGGGQLAGPVPTPEHTGIKALFSDLFDDVKHLPASENYWIAAIGGGAAMAVHPADSSVTSYLVDASWAHNVFRFGAVLGDTPELLGASIGVYAVGRFKGESKISHVGMDMLQAIAVNEMMVYGLKYATRRERPDGSGADSFPSGHASNTFAVATALERHAGWKLAFPAYAFASYVAASRLHDNRHYLSDVVFGAAVGTIAGRTVTRHGREFPITVAAVPGGAELVYMRNGK
jgi:membrane-associated phospholipid phosphatase